MASVSEIDSALERLYRLPENIARDNARDGADYIKNVYGWDTVQDMYWKPFLERVRGELW